MHTDNETYKPYTSGMFQELINPKRTEIKHEFMGTSSLSPHIGNCSSPRSVMDFSHVAAHLPLLTPDERLIKSGIEYEMGKYINDVRVEENCTVKGMVARYQEYGINPPGYSVFVEFEKLEEDGVSRIYLDYIDTPMHRSNHSFFGHFLRPTQQLLDISYNATLPKEAILATSDSYGLEGSYNYGLSANVAFMSHPSVSDDGIVISESFAERAKFTSITKRVININKNTIPVNVYGDANTYKPFPDIGEKVRPDGLLCAIRERNDWFSVYDLNDANMSQFDVLFDTPTYVSTDSTVVDISIIKGNSKPEFSSKMTQQLDQYADMLLNHHKRIIDIYERWSSEKKALFGESEHIRLTPRMHRLVTDSYVKYNAATTRKYSLCYRKLPIDQYRVEITTMTVIKPTLGFKLTSVFADKGVVTAILPDEHMPVDANGVRADIITDSFSTISRMNIGRTYEAYLGAVSRDNRNRLIEHVGKAYAGQITPECVSYCHQYLKGLYSLLNSEMVMFIDSLNEQELHYHVSDVLTRQMSLYFPPDNENNIVDVIESIERSVYRPHLGKVHYFNNRGERVRTKENIRIGVLYYMFLEKIANSHSAVSSSKVNNFGFPVKGANVDKPKYPHSQNPIKFMGETEDRILASYIGPDATADMVDLALNPSSHKALIRAALESDNSFFAKDFDIDRKDIPYGQTKSLQILNHVFTAAGFNIEVTPNHYDNQ